MSEQKPETARECAEKLLFDWYKLSRIGTGYISDRDLNELYDAITAALEERERERDHIKALLTEVVRISYENPHGLASFFTRLDVIDAIK
jgi:hypothetical protein